MTAHPDDAHPTGPAHPGRPAPPPPPRPPPEPGPDPVVAQHGVRQSTAGVPYRSYGRPIGPDGGDGTLPEYPAVRAPKLMEAQRSGADGTAPPLQAAGTDRRHEPGDPLAEPAVAGPGAPASATGPGAIDPAGGQPTHGDGPIFPPEPAAHGSSYERRLEHGDSAPLAIPDVGDGAFVPPESAVYGASHGPALKQDGDGAAHAAPDAGDGAFVPPPHDAYGASHEPGLEQGADGAAHATSNGDGDAFVPPEPPAHGPARERRLRLTLMLCGAAVTVGMGVAIALLMEGASPPLRLGASGAGSGASTAPAEHVSSGASGALAGDSGAGAALVGDPACPLAGGPAGCPAMVAVPAGRYRIGTVQGDPDAQDEELGGAERPIAAFELSAHEITAGQWQLCVNDGACPPPLQAASAAAMPVTGISWDAAVAYTAWLSDKTGRRYRLPSEAEWEYAARAGAATPFPWGERLGQRHAHCGQCGTLDLYPRLAPVGSFAPHRGLYDMVGNAYEWVADCWTANHAQPSPPQPACRDRVQKGGAFDTLETDVRPVARTYGDRNVADLRVGFRVAREVAPPAHMSQQSVPRTEQ